MKTTLNAIRAHRPCADGWEKLLRHLGKTTADEEPLRIATIVQSNGLADALWCLRAVKGHEREIRLYAVWCARQVQHLMMDPRSVHALDVAERFARGEASADEWTLAKKAAKAAENAANNDAYKADCRAGGLRDHQFAYVIAMASHAAYMAVADSNPGSPGFAAAMSSLTALSHAASPADKVPTMAKAVADQRDELLRLCAEIDAREDAQ